MLRPAADPPVVLTRPWYPLVVRFLGASEANTSFSFSLVYEQLTTQLGFGGSNLGIQLRILEVRVWELGGAGNGTVTLIPFRFHQEPTESTNTGEFQPQVDVQGKNHWARAGFKWPDSISANPIYPTNLDDQRSVFALAGEGTYEIHLHVLWKFDERGSNRGPGAYKGQWKPSRFDDYRGAVPMETED